MNPIDPSAGTLDGLEPGMQRTEVRIADADLMSTFAEHEGGFGPQLFAAAPGRLFHCRYDCDLHASVLY